MHVTPHLFAITEIWKKKQTVQNTKCKQIKAKEKKQDAFSVAGASCCPFTKKIKIHECEVVKYFTVNLITTHLSASYLLFGGLKANPRAAGHLCVSH